MRTVSTKLDNKIAEQFMTLCNDEGKCQSEFLRDLIETLCEDCSDEDNQLLSTKDIEPISELKNPTVKIIYD